MRIVLVAYAHMPLTNAHAHVSSVAIGLNSSPGLHLHQYFKHTSSEGSDESAHMSAHMRRLV